MYVMSAKLRSTFELEIMRTEEKGGIGKCSRYSFSLSTTQSLISS
jgi:hypothetical protein